MTKPMSYDFASLYPYSMGIKVTDEQRRKMKVIARKRKLQKINTINMKVLKVNTPIGQYALPAILIAEERANYYACEVDEHEYDSDEWLEEVMFGFDDDYEMIDWLMNNEDWKDWEDCSKKLNDNVLVTDDDFWSDSDDVEITTININE
jgi:enolase